MSQHHDPVHPDSDHLTPEVVADLDEGLLDAESSTHVQHHLDQCDQCRDLHRQLREVQAALSDLPPVAMPEDVEARILAKLPISTSKTIVPIGQAPSRRSGNTLGRVLTATAGVAAVLLVAAVVYPMFTSDDANPTNANRGNNFESLADTNRQTPNIQLASYAATTSGTNYTADTMTRQVDELVGPVPATGMSASVSSSPSASELDSPSPDTSATESIPSNWTDPAMKHAAGLPLITDPSVAEDCVVNKLEAHFAPLAIDLGRYQGRPAVVIVLPAESQPTTLAEIWVINPGCTGANPVLDYFQVPLP